MNQQGIMKGAEAMRHMFMGVLWLSKIMNVVAVATLTFMMFLTVSDVILRYAGYPVRGTYELVALSGAVVIGFAIPYTSWMKGHVYVDMLIERLGKRSRAGMLIFAKVLGILFFIMVGIHLIENGISIRESGEVSATLQLPFYPIAYGLGVCCFIECLVLFCDILKIARGEYE